MDRRLLYAALFGKSAVLESHDKAIVAVNAKNVAAAGQTTALFFSGAAAWYGVWSQLGNSVVAMTADELEDMAHVSESMRKPRQAFEDLEAEINIGLSRRSSVRSSTKDSCS
jgi:hypothetical protein